MVDKQHLRDSFHNARADLSKSSAINAAVSRTKEILLEEGWTASKAYEEAHNVFERSTESGTEYMHILRGERNGTMIYVDPQGRPDKVTNVIDYNREKRGSVFRKFVHRVLGL